MRKSSDSGKQGYLIFVLHTHLPYIRYPEHEHYLEEQWFFEAMTETYIPLLETFEKLIDDKVDFRITLSLTPTLIEMLNDELLLSRYVRYIESRIELAEKEISRTRRQPLCNQTAHMYHRRFLRIRRLFEKTYRKDLPGVFRSLADTGKVELITSAATHAYLPVHIHDPIVVSAQIRLAVEHYRKAFGRRPRGIWLPECGFLPGLDREIKRAGLRFFILEKHGILGGIPQPRHGIYRPVKTPEGVVVFGRDAESSKQVWSSIEGYPGDFDYRDFYRDIGFDLKYEYVKPFLPDGIRTFTGMKYYRITGKTERKKPYVMRQALHKARMHAGHFLASRAAQIAMIHQKLKIKPVITAAYDTELFGHWWFEGPVWLETVLRKGASFGNSFRFITPSEYMAQRPELREVMPSMSSWGKRGYSITWIDESNKWIYRHLHRAAKLMRAMADSYPTAGGAERRALNQCCRELLLAQASDWPFMMHSGNAGEFAQKTFTGHMNNFFMLQKEIVSGRINLARLAALEKKNNIFHDLDYRIFKNIQDS